MIQDLFLHPFKMVPNFQLILLVADLPIWGMQAVPVIDTGLLFQTVYVNTWTQILDIEEQDAVCFLDSAVRNRSLYNLFLKNT